MTANTTPARHSRSTTPSRPTAQPVTAALVPEALLTWQTLVALTGCSETTLRRLRAADPTFPRLHRLAGCARFRAVDVRGWLAAQRPADEAQGAALPP